MAIPKYTSQSLVFTIGSLVDNAAHFTGSYFWTDTKITDNIHVGTGNSLDEAYTGSTTLNGVALNNLSDGTTEITVTAYARARWDSRGLVSHKSNVATKPITIRQHARKTLSKTSSWIWVGKTSTVSYGFSQKPYNSGVAISATEGATTSTAKAAATATNYVVLTGVKKGTSNVTFTSSDGIEKNMTETVDVRQHVSEIKTNVQSITVVKGAEATIYLGVSATNSNDSDATANIYNATVTHTFSGSATGSNKNATTITAAKTDSPSAQTGTAVELTNITKGGEFVITSAAGVGGPSKITKTISITVNSLKIEFFTESTCTTQTTNTNSGAHIYVKVSGGVENTTGDVSCDNSDCIVKTPTVSLVDGITEIWTPSDGSGEVNVKVHPTGNTNFDSDVTESFKIIPISLVLS